MLPLRIAVRFLRTSPIQSLLIVAGIAVGIGVNIFLGSLITSLQASLVETTIGAAPHVTVKAPKQGDYVTFTEAMRTILKADARVTAIAPVRDLPVVFTNGTDSAPLSLKGGELVQLDSIYEIVSRTVQGRPRLGSSDIMVGTTFADKYALAPGSTVTLRLPGGSRATLRVSGIFDLGSSTANERTAFTSGSFVARPQGAQSSQFSAVEVQVAQPFDSASIAAGWRQRPAFAGTDVVDWQAQNKDLLQALQSQSGSSNMIQTFVLLAVAIGITSTLAISAVQKTRQIGILKAMGMADGAAGLIFLWEASILGLAGTVAGVSIGLGLIAFFASAATTRFDILPEPRLIAITCLVGMSVALLSAVFPARKTSGLDPIDVVQSG